MQCLSCHEFPVYDRLSSQPEPADWAENYFLPPPATNEARAAVDPEGLLYTAEPSIAKHTEEHIGMFRSPYRSSVAAVATATASAMAVF